MLFRTPTHGDRGWADHNEEWTHRNRNALFGGPHCRRVEPLYGGSTREGAVGELQGLFLLKVDAIGMLNGLPPFNDSFYPDIVLRDIVCVCVCGRVKCRAVLPFTFHTLGWSE